MTNGDRAKIRQSLQDGLAEGPLTECGPFLCYLTIDGLDRTDPRKLIALRGRIHAAARTAAEGRATTYHANDSTITIGIRGPDANTAGPPEANPAYLLLRAYREIPAEYDHAPRSTSETARRWPARPSR